MNGDAFRAWVPLVLILSTIWMRPVIALECLALTDSNGLVRFDSTSPSVSTVVPITGLPMGYNLLGIDVRTTTQTVGAANPGVGSVWAIGRNGMIFRLFSIDPSTGVATAIGGDLAGITNISSDNAWFFGFDPATDRIRFMGETENYEINPNTLAVTQQTDIAGFINFNGSAFTTAAFGGTSQPYFVEVGGDELRTSTAIQTGASTVVGSLGISITLPNGLDIYESDTLLLADPSGPAELFSVNRTTGLATPLGAVLPDVTYRAMTINPPTFPPTPTPTPTPTPPVVDGSATIRVNGKKRIRYSGNRVQIRGTAQSEVGIQMVRVRVAGQRGLKKAKGKDTWRFVAKRLSKKVTRVRIFAISNTGDRSKTIRLRLIRND